MEISKNTIGFSDIFSCFVQTKYMWIEKSDNFVLLTFAQSLDGFIGKKGQSIALSSQESLVLTHSLRNQFDGNSP